jgi:uncharacterized repeat protein (TIGR03803 family)
LKSIRAITIFSAFCLFSALGLAQTISELVPFSGSLQSQGGDATLTQGRDGQLYGTTSGYPQSLTGGTIFQMSPAGVVHTLHTFDGVNGGGPYSAPILASDGNFYGTASSGGSTNYGVLYKIDSQGDYTVVYSFEGGADGGYPSASPIEGSDGNLYGTSEDVTFGSPIFYRYDLSSAALTPILALSSDLSQGAQTESPLLQASDGTLWSTFQYAIPDRCGAVVQLTTAGTLLQVYTFAGGSDGCIPFGGLVQAADGNLYGTTYSGGASRDCFESRCGTIFEISDGTFSYLHRFIGYPDGATPIAGLTEGSDGNLYGTTSRAGIWGYGIVFQLTPAHQYNVLNSFLFRDGRETYAALAQHTNGKFYGNAAYGGRYNDGTIYTVDTGLEPFIALVVYTGQVGGTVQILGESLKSATAVTINGVAATSFNVASDTFMTAVIPAGAASGPVVVTTATGNLMSNHNLLVQ